MNKTQLLEQSADRIATIQHHIKSVESASSFICNRRSGTTVDCGSLHRQLMEAELDEWRQFAMWGLTMTAAVQNRVKAAVYERFLREHMDVSHWLPSDVSQPDKWMRANEDDFREMARIMFAPRDARSGKEDDNE